MTAHDYSKPLKNVKHEHFARHVAEGVKPINAYEKAGYKKHWGNAKRLAQADHVARRVEWLASQPDEVTPQNYYTYALIDPRNGKPFYIGKGKNDRAYRHVGHARNGNVIGNTYKHRKIRRILDTGLEPIVRIISSCLDEKTALRRESFIIDMIGLENLTNFKRGEYSNWLAERALGNLRKIIPYSEWMKLQDWTDEQKTYYHKVVSGFEALAKGA